MLSFFSHASFDSTNNRHVILETGQREKLSYTCISWESKDIFLLLPMTMLPLHFSGAFKFNKFHGTGELHYPDGSIYKGEFDRGERSGSGTYTQPGGVSYEGQWMHDLKDGRGKMEYENGDVYEGTWMQDMV